MRGSPIARWRRELRFPPRFVGSGTGPKVWRNTQEDCNAPDARFRIPYNGSVADSHNPQRIACLQPSATVILASAGELDRVVACTQYCADVVSELRRVNRLIIAESWTCNARDS